MGWKQLTDEFHSLLFQCEELLNETDEFTNENHPFTKMVKRQVQTILQDVMIVLPEPTEEEMMEMITRCHATEHSELLEPTEDEMNLMSFSLKYTSNGLEYQKAKQQKNWKHFVLYDGIIISVNAPLALLNGLEQNYFPMAGNLLSMVALTVYFHGVFLSDETAEKYEKIATAADWEVLAMFLNGINWEEKTVATSSYFFMAAMILVSYFHRNLAKRIKEKEKILKR